VSTPPEVAVELERIRSTMQVGFAEQAGRLDLLIQRANQTDQTTAELKAGIKALDERITAEATKVDDRVTPLERKQWPWPTVSGVAAAVAAFAAIWPHFSH
jgi:hypothetical protein